MNASQFVIKTELAEAFDSFTESFAVRMEKMVGQVMGEIVGDALQVISERFNKIEVRLDKIEARLDSLEKRQDGMQDTIGHHGIDIKALQRKIA